MFKGGKNEQTDKSPDDGDCCIAGMAMSVTTAFSGEYPDRPVGVAVSYGAGGATDFQARIVTMVAGNEDVLGQPIYIVNKPGAGGRVGWNWFATEADADGYMMSAYNIRILLPSLSKAEFNILPTVSSQLPIGVPTLLLWLSERTVNSIQFRNWWSMHGQILAR